ncbi:pentapeptide repeat-containing protein [Rhodopseudomonas sp. HC1]|uniref:pentapeptide repeat-containing protein n=1 Tax=Rhodopseudomonas infernalis TaxID=2897386 RepID=UPI001EE954B8|nr:pentapeptide repeat-containing protein [Rhodopseudomonas infernalis]MCG6203285.1 pentapeptide repeat-containing protein [Rhodopseudomonas infernalis]
MKINALMKESLLIIQSKSFLGRCLATQNASHALAIGFDIQMPHPTRRTSNPRHTTTLPTLIVGLAIGGCLGPALFLSIDKLELSGGTLLAFSVGAFLSLGLSLAAAVVGLHLILPRILARTRGTLNEMIGNLTSATHSITNGDTAQAIDSVGLAVAEGATWYSISVTRRFATQAALGLLISFGSTIGATLLLNQNTLLHDQNDLLKDQNTKIDEQLTLLKTQNGKIDQQTAVADSQKRGAFVTEMFSILQEVAKTAGQDGILPKELMSRIAVLSTSSVPYIYLDFLGAHGAIEPKPIPRPLSPERGQLVVALARMSVKFEPLMHAGAIFTYSDLRGVNLLHANMAGIDLQNSDLSSANLNNTDFFAANLSGAILTNVAASYANFDHASITNTIIEDSNFRSATFRNALLQNVDIKRGAFGFSDFRDCRLSLTISFENVDTEGRLPLGINWPVQIQKTYEGGEKLLNYIFVFPSNIERVGKLAPSILGR